MADRSPLSLRFSDGWLPRVDVINTRATLLGAPVRFSPGQVERTFYGVTRPHAFRRALAWKQEQERGADHQPAHISVRLRSHLQQQRKR